MQSMLPIFLPTLPVGSMHPILRRYPSHMFSSLVSKVELYFPLWTFVDGNNYFPVTTDIQKLLTKCCATNLGIFFPC